MGNTIPATLVNTIATAVKTNPSSPQATTSSVGNPAAEPQTHWSDTPTGQTLFSKSGEPSPDDVVEGGNQGDCSLLADLSLIAQKNPQFIKDHIQQFKGADGKPEYHVELYNAAGKPVTVTLNDKQLRNADGTLAAAGYSSQDSSKELWPALFEEAYAKVNGNSMNVIYQDGDASKMLQTLTGKQGDEFDNASLPQNAAAFAATVNSNTNGVTMVTPNSLTSLPTYNKSTQSATIDGRYVLTQPQGQNGMFLARDTHTGKEWQFPPGHCLALASLHPTSDGDYNVSLTNPWGPSSTEQENLGSVPYAIARSLTAAYSVNGIPPKEAT